jgi:SP family general alpha glucoside:H+ symporter-like MFS transporter
MLTLDSLVVAIITGVVTPYMLNPDEWDWQNYAGFFWAVICFFCIIYTFFRLPEPRGRTFAELDVLFEKGIPARKFSTTDVDVYHEHVEDAVMNKFNTVVDPKLAHEGGHAPV